MSFLSQFQFSSHFVVEGCFVKHKPGLLTFFIQSAFLSLKFSMQLSQANTCIWHNDLGLWSLFLLHSPTLLFSFIRGLLGVFVCVRAH
jgi:hypothetical protein